MRTVGKPVESCRGPGASGGWKGLSMAWVGGSNGWVGSRGSWEVSGVEDLSRAIESAEGVFPDDFYASVKVEVMKAFGLLLREMPDRFDLVIGSKSLFLKS